MKRRRRRKTNKREWEGVDVRRIKCGKIMTPPKKKLNKTGVSKRHNVIITLKTFRQSPTTCS